MYIKAHRQIDLGNGLFTTGVDEYTVIGELSFDPAVDLVGASLPIDEFQADIHTADTIDIGAYAELYDDSDGLWASYWVIYAEHIDARTLRVVRFFGCCSRAWRASASAAGRSSGVHTICVLACSSLLILYSLLQPRDESRSFTSQMPGC